MPLQYDPELAAAFVPLAELMAAKPKFARGDAIGRREMSNAMFIQTTAALPDCPSVTRTNHSIKSFDGTYITVSEFHQEGKPRGTKALYYIHGG